MKIISLIIFAGALVGSWTLVHHKRPVPQSVHVGIQNDLKNIIADYIQKNLPESKNLKFHKFWTETLNKNQVQATFVYSFDNPEASEEANVQIEGLALLNKIAETPELVTWSFDQLWISGNKVTFASPIQITAEAQVPKEAPAEPKAAHDEHH